MGAKFKCEYCHVPLADGYDIGEYICPECDKEYYTDEDGNLIEAEGEELEEMEEHRRNRYHDIMSPNDPDPLNEDDY